MVKSATRSVGLRQLILVLLILRGISCLYYKEISLWHIPQLWYYPGHIGKCTRSLFCGEEELFFILKGGPSHHCGWGQTAWPLTEKIGRLTFILSRPFNFAIVLLLFEANFWLSRRIWFIGCLQIILFHLKYRYEGLLLVLELFLDSISVS